MANPNIVDVTSIFGKTAGQAVTVSPGSAIVTNSASSGKILKINSLIISNIDGTNAADITVKYHLQAAGAGTSVPVAYTITVPADASLVIVNKDSQIYLEENRSFTAQASIANGIAIICSYDEIS